MAPGNHAILQALVRRCPQTSQDVRRVDPKGRGRGVPKRANPLQRRGSRRVTDNFGHFAQHVVRGVYACCWWATGCCRAASQSQAGHRAAQAQRIDHGGGRWCLQRTAGAEGRRFDFVACENRNRAGCAIDAWRSARVIPSFSWPGPTPSRALLGGHGRPPLPPRDRGFRPSPPPHSKSGAPEPTFGVAAGWPSPRGRVTVCRPPSEHSQQLPTPRRTVRASRFPLIGSVLQAFESDSRDRSAALIPTGALVA
jgi:hypothetical protein